VLNGKSSFTCWINAREIPKIAKFGYSLAPEAMLTQSTGKIRKLIIDLLGVYAETEYL